MAQYQDEEDQYITGGTIDDSPIENTPTPIPRDLAAAMKPVTADPDASASWGTHNLEMPDAPYMGMGFAFEPITTIPVLSTVTRAIGSAAKAIDNILPTTPLDSFIPDIETIANFTPGIGDLETGEYSALDMLGLGLDVFGLGVAGDALKGAKGAKLTHPQQMHLYETAARELGTNTGRLGQTRRQLHFEETGEALPGLHRGESYNRVPEYTEEVMPNTLLDDALEEYGVTEALDPRASIIARNRQARANIDYENIPVRRTSMETRAQLDAIGAPSDEAFARMSAELDAGIIPESVLEGQSKAALRVMDAEADAARRLQSNMSEIKYENFSIDQGELFDIVDVSGGAKHRYFRNDRSNSNVIVELHPTGRKGEMRVSLTEGGRVNTEGVVDRMDDINRPYLNYHINVAGDDPIVSGFHFYSRGADRRSYAEAGRLIRDTMNHLPKGAIIDESTLTMDSLYLMINQLAKSGRKGQMNIKRSSIIPENIRTNVAPVSEKSMPSLLVRGGNPERALRVFQDVEQRLIKQGKLDPADGLGLELTMAGDKVGIKFNTFTISDLKAAIPLMLGVEDWEAFEKLMDNEDDLVNSVIDLEQGIFE